MLPILAAACWAFSATGAIEAAQAIASATMSVTPLSDQQVINCALNSNCNGGWPGEAFQYASTHLLQPASKLPYKSFKNSSGCPSSVPSGVQTTSFEEVSFSGWLGLVLAVQQQPVVVAIDASTNRFQTFVVRHRCPYP